MKVRQLIELLRRQDPDAVVTIWPDIHEGGGPVLVENVRVEYVKLTDPLPPELDYSNVPKEGFVPAVRIE